ncbi:EF-hand domain-containing protein [Gimesia sp.]|uniref:EF-hand domain-containing protein n=1 Tax=Gimesia sp. TaxID=2024833 RepID=UPI003A93459F
MEITINSSPSRNIRFFVAPSQRTLPHPIQERVSQRCHQLQADWGSYDTNGDGKLSPEEFKDSKLAQSVPGLAATIWKDWDRNQDGVVDQQDAEQMLEIAYGLRYITGVVLWEPSGRMLTTMLFDHLDLNGDHQIDLQEAKQAKFGFRDGKQTPVLFKEWDQDGNGKLSITEWKAEPSHWRDPVGAFLAADKNYDGYLSQEELVAAAESWTKGVSEHLLGAFDLDSDQHLSLDEFRQTPFSNLAREWHSLRSDRNQDGALNLSEFSWGDGLLAATLTVEYFERLDLNQDRKLDQDEFIFKVAPSKASLGTMFAQLDLDQDGSLSFEEYLGNLKLPPNANEKQVIYYETRLARLEDAFRKADININKKLDQLEFQSEPSLEAIAPNLVQKKKNLSSLTVGKSDGSEAAGGNTEIWIVLTLNGLLLIGAIVFILRKTKRSTH